MRLKFIGNLTCNFIFACRAMCSIDFGLPVDLDEEKDLVNFQVNSIRKLANGGMNGRSKRKLIVCETETKLSRKNFEFFAFRDPVLFIGHLSKNSMLIMDKPWIEVVKTFDAPVHRHIFGS